MYCSGCVPHKNSVQSISVQLSAHLCAAILQQCGAHNHQLLERGVPAVQECLSRASRGIADCEKTAEILEHWSVTCSIRQLHLFFYDYIKLVYNYTKLCITTLLHIKLSLHSHRNCVITVPCPLLVPICDSPFLNNHAGGFNLPSI